MTMSAARWMMLACLAASGVARAADGADEQAACGKAGGSFLTGKVIKGPTFAHGQFRKGVELSHTHLSVLADQDGKNYDVAIDNVYASGYDAAKATVPAPLNTIRVSDRVELCGQLYSRGVGIHWVHSNCGARPSQATPDGWLKVLSADGTPGQNYEGSEEYCKLFN